MWLLTSPFFVARLCSVSRVLRFTWYNSLWLWRWLPHRLSKRQSLSTTTVLFRTTFTRTIKLNLLKYWKSCANWSNITALRFGDQGTKEILQLLSQKFDRFQTLRNNSQQHATGCAMQTDAACNIYQCWEPRLYVTSNNVALVFIKSFYNWKCDPLLETENLKISIN